MSQINFDDDQYLINEPKRHYPPKKTGIFRSCACFFILLLIVFGIVIVTIATILMPYKEKTDQVSQVWNNFVNIDFTTRLKETASGLFSKPTGQWLVDTSKQVASSTWQKMTSSSNDVIQNITSTTKASLSSSTNQIVNQATSSAWDWLKNTSANTISSIMDKLLKK
ncbi:MAG: hypothetical protein WCL61_02240 [bacterium]